MTERPAYRELDFARGQRYFDCKALRASLSTTACAQRWAAAAPGTACHQCPVGRMHHEDHSPTTRAGRRPSDRQVGACLRCGRTDLRIVKVDGICVSCANRQYEWIKGRNAKGKPPERFKPLHDVETAIQHADGRIERRIHEVRDAAEALGRTLRDLPDGARFTSERRPTSWNARTNEFELVCPRCHVAGLVLERTRGGVLERHHWCCAGSDPVGAGWQPAVVRVPLLAMHVEAAAAALNGDPELEGEAPSAWTPTPHPCAACHSGQVEAQVLASGKWQCRCKACGAESS